MHTDRDLKARQRAMWAAGDYHSFATSMLWDLGPRLVAACGIGPGQRVLDVAAGTGNVAIRAAEAGATVIASDLTPENFGAGRVEAAAHGVEIEWVEADAEALPFADGEFDVVTSSLGAIFAPHHQTVADELLRVCRPGGTIGLIALVPSSAIWELFDVASHYPASSVAFDTSSLQWGEEQHVRELFGDRVESLSVERLEQAHGPLADIELVKHRHPVFVTLYRGLADDPEASADLDHRLAELTHRWRSEPMTLLMVVARKRRD
jgi:SAM-dependent methyltransferase